MIRKISKKLLFSICIIVITLCILDVNLITYAENGDVEIQADVERESGDGTKNTYSLSDSGEELFKIVASDGGSYFCLDAETAHTWNQYGYGTPITYDTYYDMDTQVDEIKNLNISVYKKIVTNENYPQILWVLDHMYTKEGITKNQLLEDAGIVYGIPANYDEESGVKAWYPTNSAWSGYYEGYNVSGEDVILSEEEVEAVQQAVLWSFTNGFNIRTETGTPANWLNFDESNSAKKSMKREQAAIVANYLINGATAAGSNYKTIKNGTIKLEFTDPNTQKAVEGNKVKIGPLKATVTGNTVIDNITVTVGTTNVEVKELRNSAGNKIQKVTPGETFYVIIEKPNENTKIKVDATGKCYSTKKTLWLKKDGVENGVNEEQPLVRYEGQKINATTTPVTIEKEPYFDLALRKIITKVNGKTTFINENKLPAARTITADKSTIPETATYKHRKDPVVVKTGDTVTYRITIYNEGDIDGYATKIVDQLPTGVKSVLKTGDTVTSKNNQNVYTVNYNESTNTLEFSMTTKKEAIKAFDGTTLKEDYIELDCKVEQKAATDGTTKRYLTNIAYIAEEYDTDNNKITADRDGNESKPTESPNKSASALNNTDANNYRGGSSKSVYSDTNNEQYFEGEQDDDDFEKVVVLPETFDLKLMKFISAINSNQTTRRITIDSSKLKSGSKTTADYDVNKEPLLVQKGDIVTYTIRIYNEGEIDGYASEISEDIPEGLEYDASLNTNPSWTVSNDGKTITTNYLSKDVSEDNLLSAFDRENDDGEGSGLSHKDVTVKLRVTTENATKIIRNEAAITEDTDKDGNPIKDRDSDTEEWKKEDSEETYKNNPDYPKYKEDDEDYDNIKLVLPDLSLRKFITKISTDRTFSTSATKTYNRTPDVDTSKLKAGTADTAIYNHSKEPIYLNVEDYVLYTIRVYNEGEVDAYASQVKDYLPEYLDFVDSTDTYVSSINGNWERDPNNSRTLITKSSAPNATTKLKAFNKANDDGKGSGLDYVDIQMICKVNTNVTANTILTNIAEISKYKNSNNVEISKDRDSEPNNFPDNKKNNEYNGNGKQENYVPGQQDDDDFEKVIIRKPGTYDLVIVKEDKNGEQLNSTATFEVKVGNNAPETKTVTGRLTIAKDVEINGENVDTPDVYTIKETKAPDEYCEFGGTITITVNKKIEGTSYKVDSVSYEMKDADGNIITSDDAYVHLSQDGNIYVEVKNYEEPDIHKGVKTVENQDSGYDKDEEHTWAIRSDIPGDVERYKKYEIVDDIDYRLNYVSGSVVAKIGNTTLVEGTDYTLEYDNTSTSTKSGTLKLTFISESQSVSSKLTSNAGKKIDVTFKTTFVTDSEGNIIAGLGTEVPNQAKLVYTNAANIDGEKETETPEVHTGGVTLFKYYKNGEEKKALKDAEFKIYRTEADAKANRNAIMTEESDENGIVKFVGLEYGEDASDKEENKKADGTYDHDSSKQSTKYWVAETKVPEDYTGATDPIEVTINATSYEQNATKIIYQVENKKKPLDLSLRKFIQKVSSNGDFEDEKTTVAYNREPQVDVSKLKAGTAKTATYNHSKEPIGLFVGDYILYTIRVYNEGEVDGYASQVIDYLPEYLDFVQSEETQIKSINDNWTYDETTRKVTTKSDASNATTLLKAFDKENDETLDYVDIQIVCRVNSKVPANTVITNIAEISEYKDKNKEIVEEDRDSKPDNFPEDKKNNEYNGNGKEGDYVPGQEDDDDFEKVIIREFDLALRKFITDISGKEVTTRVPKLSYENGKITYTHPKDVVKVVVGDTVTYTLRVFNEGNIAGYAEKITDDIPEYLEYLPENETNKEYKWVMYDKEGKETDKVEEAEKIVTDYASKANGEENLLKAFDKEAGISETNPSHIDVKVAFKVKDPKSNKIVITNKAQISEDADENGKPVNDIDSIPDEWNEGEDDQDYENVSVEYFDLSLLKYVTKAIVTENGKTKTTKTGNTGASTDITPKVEIYRKRVKTTIVKFEYTIKVTNEGDIEGYAKELTDYVPEGLKFYSEDNKGWKDEGNNVISTELLKDTLLKPGQSATVKVILRWVNGENNLGLKTNVAEISKDYNEKGVPDRDSTPDNKKPGEDDIDDAPVLLTISTGILENTIPYVAGTLGVLVVLGLGVVAIKKYVL